MPSPRKPKSRTPTVCGTCMAILDRAAIERALRDGTEYACVCGRVLVRGA